MKTPAKIGLGLVAISPFPLILLMFGLFIYLIGQHPNDIQWIFNEHPVTVLMFNTCLTILIGGTQVFYLIHAARNPGLAEMRVTWILAILFLGAFVTPFYWYHHIWHEGRKKQVSGPLGLDSG